jgi:uroporphyrinogen-III synthase
VSELSGATVILTRAPADNAALEATLRARGAAVIALPCVTVRALDDDATLRRALRALTHADRLVLTSRAGAEAVGAALGGERLDAPVAVVGPATRAAAVRVGLSVDFVASHPDGATLARELPLPEGAVVLARSDRALRDLPELLRARGVALRELVAYHTERAAEADVARAREALAAGEAIVCLASPSAVDGFVDLVGEALARAARPIAIGPTTAARIRERLEREPAIVPSLEPADVARAIANLPLEVARGRRH